MLEEGDRSVGTARRDNFVDAAFAFAVGLLVVTAGTPQTLDELRAVLAGAPAFAFSFAMLMIFWASHRRYGEIAPRRDVMSTLLSLGVVFVVLIYVYPLRLLSQISVRYMSGGLVEGGIQLTSWSDLRLLYVVYGLFFAILAGLFFGLFAHALRARVQLGLTHPGEARDSAARWASIAGVGLLSTVLALVLPIHRVPWAPGMTYCLIPVAMAVWNRVLRPPPAPSIARSDASA